MTGHVAHASATATRGSEAGTRWVPPLLAVAALAVRLLWLRRQSLSMDELAEVGIAHESIPSVLGAHDGFPPLYNLLLHGWLTVVPTDVNARLLSAILGTVSVWVVWRLALRAGGPGVALWAAVVMALSPFQIWFSQEARAYTLYGALMSAALASLVWALETDRREAWAAYVVFVEASLLTHYHAGLFVVCGVVLLVAERGVRISSRAAWAHVAIVVLSIPALLFLRGDLLAETSAPFAITFRASAIPYTLYALLVGFGVGPSIRELHVESTRRVLTEALPWLTWAFGAAAVLLVQGLRRLGARRWGIRLLVLTALPIVLAVGAAGLAGITYQVRHVLWAFVPLAVVLGAGGASWPRSRAAGIAMVALLALFLTSVYRRQHLPRYANEDLAGLARYLGPERGTGPVLVLSSYMAGPVGYYLGPGWTADTVPDVSGDESLRRALDATDSVLGGRTGWLVYTREFHGDPAGAFLAALTRAGRVERRHTFAGIMLYRVVPSAQAGAR